MRTSVAVLALCLLYLPVANAASAFALPCVQKLKELEDRLTNNEKVLEMLKQEITGNTCFFLISYFQQCCYSLLIHIMHYFGAAENLVLLNFM